jgi:hypothetical protein
MTPGDQPARAVVVVHAADRTWRSAVDAALREAGVRPRLASRPAELAKSLADGVARLVIAGPTAADDADVAALRPRCPVHATTPGDTIAEIVRRALAAVEVAGPNQATGPTSSK